MDGLTRPLTAVPPSVTVGVLATLSMDAVFVAASLLGGARFTSDKIGLELVGRWAGGLARGRLRHADMAAEPPLRGEAALGLAVHYLTGIALTQVYYGNTASRRPQARRALGDGLWGRHGALAPARHVSVVGARPVRASQR